MYDHLVQRSGILREPVPGRVDFVHGTFQEYLTAIESAERGDVGLLMDKADNESWRNIIVMAAGHANAPVRSDLIAQILSRADAHTDSGRGYALLAAACLETVPSVEPADLLREIQRHVMPLLPPRSRDEGRVLSAMGDPLLRYLPPSTELLAESEAVATVYAAALVNGPKALATLARYAQDGRDAVQREIAASWEYFDPDEYAQRVLADARLPSDPLTIGSPHLLGHLGRLKNLKNYDVDLTGPADLSVLGPVPGLASLSLRGAAAGAVRSLGPRSDLWRLAVYDLEDETQVLPLPALDGLLQLNLQGRATLSSLDFLRALPQLFGLGLSGLSQIRDWAPLLELPALQQLLLVQPSAVDLSQAASLPALTYLSVIAAEDLGPSLPDVFAGASNLTTLQIARCPWLTDLTGIERLTTLTGVSLQGCQNVIDLAPLAQLTDLWGVHLDGCTAVSDISVLAGLPRLHELRLVGTAPGVDLSAFAGRADLTIWVAENQQVSGADRLGSGVHIYRAAA